MGMFDTIEVSEYVKAMLVDMDYPKDGENTFQTKCLENVLDHYKLDITSFYRRFTDNDGKDIYLPFSYHGTIEIHNLAGRPPLYYAFNLEFDRGHFVGVSVNEGQSYYT